MVPRLVDFAGGEGFGYFAQNEGPREGPNRLRMFPGVDVAGVASLGIRGKRWAWRGLTYPGLLPQQLAFCVLVSAGGDDESYFYLPPGTTRQAEPLGR